MNILENRYEYAQQLYNSGDYKDCKISYQLALVCRYLEHIGKTEEEINTYVLKILNKKFDNSNIINSYSLECSKIKNNLTPVRTDSLRFSKSLLEYIHSANNQDIEELLFCFACLYFYKYSNKRYFVTLSEIFSITKNRIKRGSGLFYYLYHNEFIEVKIYKYKEYVVPKEDFLLELENNHNEECELEISNFINLHYYYLNYFGMGRFGFCEHCGSIYKQIKNNQKYCKICNRITNIEKTSCKFVRKTQRHDHKKIIELYKNGKTQKEISEILNIPFGSIRRIICEKYHQ